MVNMKTRSRMSERANVWIFFVFLIILLFSVTAFAQPAKTWRTGQTVSYATGDDGDLQKGVAWPAPRFTDNGDGTVTDHLTGLIWLKNANCFGTRNWSNALADSNSLASGSCGLTDGSESGDWRLPNRKELFSIFDYSRSDPALPHGHPFTNIGFTQYWSATTSMVPYNNNYAAYVVSISGGVYHNDKTLNNHVWPVRDSDDPGYPTEDWDPVVSINVTAPVAGAQWQRGTTQTIRWTSSGSVGNVQLQLRDNSGNYSVIVNSVANTGSYNWAIPASIAIGSGYQIRVSDVNKRGTIYDHSDSFSLANLVLRCDVC